MKMKNYLLMACAGLLYACTPATQEKETMLTFDVQQPTERQVVLICHTDLHEIPLDGQGRATYTLKNTDAVYARLFYGQQQKPLYLEKGTQTHISFNGNDYMRTFKVEGDMAPATDYLNEINLAPLPHEDYALPFDQFLLKLDQKEKESLQLLEARKLEHCGKFEKMERGRIRYGMGSALLTYPAGHALMARDTAYMPDQAYYDAVKAYWTEDEDWADIDEYRGMMIELAHLMDEPNRQVTAYYPKSVAEMKYLAAHVHNEKIKQTLLHQIAVAYIEQHGIKDMTDMANVYHAYVTDSLLRADYQTKYDRWDLSSPGKPSPDFEAVDIDGNTRSLSQFKGKYVYIDLWATWCAPCRQELPFLVKLEEQFKGKNITFIGLSIDRDKSKWEQRVKSGGMPGVQLYIGAGSPFMRAYNIEGIPRFILLDKEGKIINNEMSRPSSDDTPRILAGLEGM